MFPFKKKSVVKTEMTEHFLTEATASQACWHDRTVAMYVLTGRLDLYCSNQTLFVHC